MQENEALDNADAGTYNGCGWAERMIPYVIVWAIGAVAYAIALWTAIRVLGLKAGFLGALAMAAVANGVFLAGEFMPVPYVGWILSLVVVYIMIVKLMYIDFWPTGFVLVVIAEVLRQLMVFAILRALAAYTAGV